MLLEITSDEVISIIFRAIEAVNSKDSIKQFRKSECVPRRTSHVQYWDIKFMTTIPRPDHPSETIANLNPPCTDLTELVSEKDGERPADAAHITEGSARSAHFIKTEEKVPRDSSAQFVLHRFASRFTGFYNVFILLSIENAPIISMELIRLFRS